MGMTELIFVDPGMTVNGQHYRDVLLSADAASDQACCKRIFNMTTLHLIVPRTPLNCYSKKRRNSPNLWPANNPDLNPVDYKVWAWGVMQQ